jgi:hypothetical protein
MADDVLAEALARLEHKVDAIIRHLNVSTQPMHFPGQVCPACGSFIDYQIDVTKGVVVRRCKCTTGKVPPVIPLIPVQKGVSNGNSTSGKDSAESIREDLAEIGTSSKTS